MLKVMVIAGTSDAREIIDLLVKQGIRVIATVTTDYGEELLKDLEELEVFKGKLSSVDMLDFIEKNSISFVVDASHPFAKEVSINAIDSCKLSGIPYIRFERSSTAVNEESAMIARNFEEAAEMASRIKGNIFLAIGSNNIKTFIDKIPNFKERIFARILPDSRMLAKCESAGLSAGNIFAVKGPFSVDLNIEMLKHCSASLVVSKESGDTGGTDTKLEAAKRLGIPVIIIRRPEIDYGIKVSTAADVLKFCH